MVFDCGCKIVVGNKKVKKCDRHKKSIFLNYEFNCYECGALVTANNRQRLKMYCSACTKCASKKSFEKWYQKKYEKIDDVDAIFEKISSKLFKKNVDWVESIK